MYKPLCSTISLSHYVIARYFKNYLKNYFTLQNRHCPNLELMKIKASRSVYMCDRDLGISHLESWPCLDNDIIHVGGAHTAKKERQGDEISRAETSMVLSKVLIAGVCLPSKLQKLPVKLLVGRHRLIACIVHQDLVARTWPRKGALHQRILHQSQNAVRGKLPHPWHGVLTSSVPDSSLVTALNVCSSIRGCPHVMMSSAETI